MNTTDRHWKSGHIENFRNKLWKRRVQRYIILSSNALLIITFYCLIEFLNIYNQIIHSYFNYLCILTLQIAEIFAKVLRTIHLF